MEASFVISGRCWNSNVAHRGQQLGGLVSASHRSSTWRNRVFSSFCGQQLIIRNRNNVVDSIKSLHVGAARAHGHSHPLPPPGSGAPNEDGAFLDDVSRFLYKKFSSVVSPYLPKEIDYLDWLPEGIHKKLHNSEAAATVVLREFFHFGLFYFLFVRVDGFCKWMHWLYNAKMKEHPDGTDEAYQTSNFHVMTGPIRFLIVVWAVTRLIHTCAPLLKIKLGMGLISKTRQNAMVVAVTWFVFKWKQKYVSNLTTAYRLDAPRIVAFDKVVSLILYFLALSCIGEVNGFALRSLLAVGGFSGVALGLAAKEIVSNFFGGALLFITRPFVIGEKIKAGSFSGHVQDIGFLQTKILSAERVPMVVPNQSFINQVITNYSRAENKLLQAEFPVRIQDIFYVDGVTNRVVEYLKSHPDVDSSNSTPVCYMKSVHEQGVQIAMFCVVKPTASSDFYKVQQEILIRVAEIIVSEGASLGSSGEWDPDVPSVVMRVQTPENSGVKDGLSPLA